MTISVNNRKKQAKKSFEELIRALTTNQQLDANTSKK